jgi:tetratricopeptide (TPR) repeat protein
LIAAAKPARISAIENHDWTRRWLSPWLIVGLLILVIGLVVARPWEGKASIPAVTVVPSDQTAKSRAIAGNLLVQLGSLQLANADALQLIEPQSGAKPDMTFKVGAVGEPGALHINLALIDNRGEALLWSREFVQPGGNEADLRQQLAYSAGQVLRCALDALNTKGKRLRQQTLKLYLNACATYAETSGGIDSGPVVPMFRQVIREAPDFEGGWRALLLSETDAFLGSGKEQMREQLQKDVAAARKVNPNLVEIFQAEIDLLPANAFADRMRLADKAVAIDPDNALSYAVRGGVLLHIGHMYGAVEDTLKAVQLDPLSPPLRDAYIQALLYAGRTDLALQELHEAEQLWPGATNLAEARWRIDLRYGDAREALRALQVDPRAGGWESGPSYLEARIDPSPTKVQRAIDDVLQGYKKYPRTIGHLAQVFGEFGREAELLDLLLHAPRGVAIGGVEVMFRPALIDFWNDPRSLQFAKRVGLLQFWRSSGKWPDFCNQSDLPYDCKEEAAKLAA